MEYTFFEKLSFKMAKTGMLSARNASKKLQDDAAFIRVCVLTRGGEEIGFASDRLKSDADFILGLVKKSPDVLDFCSDVVYDRYETEDGLVEKEVDSMDFISLCCCVDEDLILYFSEDLIGKYYEYIQTQEQLSCDFHGKKVPIDIQLIRYELQWIEDVMPQLVKY